MVFGSVLLAVVAFRAPLVTPPVERLEYHADVEVRLDSTCKVAIRCSDEAALAWSKEHLKRWFGFAPDLRQDTVAPNLPDEAYRLIAGKDGIVVEAGSLQGVRYALYTLRQIAERGSEGMKVSYYRLPELTIDDSPALKFRGIHLCWFPELSASYIERELRMAAYCKFNYVVLESWGVFRSEMHPWFGWPDGEMTKPAIARLVNIARDLGVTLIPQLNVFGHASAARSCVGKHAALDFNPEMQPLFEPGGGSSESMSSAWNWCLSNPAAVQTVKDLVAELHDAFGKPPYFHIGCDEAEEPTCANCRAVPYARLVCSHISGICELLRQRDARAMMWHDMLIRKGDPRWKGFYANGGEETSKLPQMLPKDVVICDWHYGKGGEAKPYPTLDYFSKECGFDTVTCPWEDNSGIVSQAAYARAFGLFGVLATTWHHLSGDRYSKLFQLSSGGCWGRGEKAQLGHFTEMWRQCGWDMGSRSYRDSGLYDEQITREILGR